MYGNLIPKEASLSMMTMESIAVHNALKGNMGGSTILDLLYKDNIFLQLY